MRDVDPYAVAVRVANLKAAHGLTAEEAQTRFLAQLRRTDEETTQRRQEVLTPRPESATVGVVRDAQGQPYPHRHDYDWHDDRKLWVCSICAHTKHLLTEIPER